MSSVKPIALPDRALLSAYRDAGAYTDCFVASVPRVVSQAEYVHAFYTTMLFKLERAILKAIVSRPSTDAEALALAEGRRETFAAWQVEGRDDDQLLLTDFRGQTRSWLMRETGDGTNENETRLYFGSAVTALRDGDQGDDGLPLFYRLLMPLHRLYSRALLASARSKLMKFQ